MTVIIAIFVAWIAFAQWYLARSKLKLDLFDRRWAVVQSIRDIVGTALEKFNLEMCTYWEFSYKTVGVHWLFGKDVEDYLVILRAKLAEFAVEARASKREPATTDTIAAVEKMNSLAVWLVDQPKEIERIFGPYMRIDEPFRVWMSRTAWANITAAKASIARLRGRSS